jgi:predicted kinase
MRQDLQVQRLVLVSGPTGTGKSVLANAIASDLSCAVGSFDWLMSALRSISEVWQVVELPDERQRLVG